MVLYNKETGGDELSFVLDLRAIIYKEKEEVDNDRNLCSIFYQIERDSNVIQFEVIPTSADGIRDVQAFDFILGQYAMKDDSLNKDGIVCEGKDRNPNVVAKGFESTGMAVRVALRSGGRYTGHAIRYLGQQYTSVVSGALGKAVEQEAENIRIDSPGESAEVERSASGDAGRLSSDENEVERANRRRVWAEGVHSAATSLTGAVLYPVRWTGRVAAELGGKGGSDRPNSENENALSKVFLDTVGGIGNGVMSVCKGVTEAMGEVGSAIGDSAMHHSVTIHGNEYADTVTKCYVDAASEIGLAGYKVANVTALGWQGVLVNAALEGTTFIVSLYEYLMGPVILQGYMEMMQLPMLKVERFFVVLRPWSIAFYRSAADITRKPYKVVATSLLDTLPKLRLRPAFEGVNGRAKTPETADCSSLLKANNPAGVAPAVPVSGQKLERGAAITTTTEKEEEDQEEDFSYWHRSDYDAFDSDTSVVQKAAAREKAETEEGGSCCTAGTPSAASRCAYSMTVRSALTQLSGGEKSHIELCTLDCSTYILYPPSETIGLWFQELSAASARVETIAKRKSGADEIALYRRLDLYPITSYVTIKVKRFVRSTPKPSMFDMFIRKRSALNTAFSDGASHSGPCQEETAQRPDEFNDSAEDGAGKLPATLRHTSLPASPEERSPENTSGSSGEVGNCESKSGEASEEETKRFPVAEEVGNISDDDDVYECSDFWVSESPDLLSGSYFEISPEDHEQPDAAATHPAIPSGSSGGSPSDLPVPASPHIPLEAIGCSAARGDNIPIAVARCRVSRSDSSNTSSGSSHGGDCKSSVGADSSQDTPTSVPPPLPLSADVTKVNRAFFAPEVQCSVYPVARSGKFRFCDSI